MGRSQSRLSSTRSGVVRSRLLLGMGAFPLSAPIPPLALVQWQSGIARLGYRRAKHVEHTWVLFLPGELGQALIKLFRRLPRQLGDVGYAEPLEISQHNRPHRNQVG